jgi:hypothetical protein
VWLRYWWKPQRLYVLYLMEKSLKFELRIIHYRVLRWMSRVLVLKETCKSWDIDRGWCGDKERQLWQRLIISPISFHLLSHISIISDCFQCLFHHCAFKICSILNHQLEWNSIRGWCGNKERQLWQRLIIHLNLVKIKTYIQSHHSATCICLPARFIICYVFLSCLEYINPAHVKPHISIISDCFQCLFHHCAFKICSILNHQLEWNSIRTMLVSFPFRLINGLFFI